MIEFTLDTLRFFERVKKYKFFLITCFLTCTISVFLYAFLVPEQFTSTAVFRSLKPENIKLSIDNSSSANLNYLFTDPNSPERSNLYCYELLNSRRFAEKTIIKFKLANYFKITDKDSLKVKDLAVKNYYSKVLRSSYDEVSELVKVSITTKDKELSLSLVNFQLQLLDEYYNYEHVAKQRKVRVFLEERIAEIKLDLDKADIALRSFQTNSNTYQIDLQIESALDNYSQILLEKNKLDLEYLIQSQLLGESSPKVKILAMRDSLLTKQISDLEFSEDETGIYKSLNKVPQYTYEYRKLKRRQNVLELMYEYLIPIYETAKINEVKAVNSMELIDSPRLAGLRTKPKRTLLILFVSMMSLILANVYITIRESLISYGAINKQ